MDFAQWDRTRRNLTSPDRRGSNNEAYRSALQAFLDRRREPAEGSEASQSPEFSPHNNRVELFCKNTKDDVKQPEDKDLIPGVPYVEASELFEVGWVAGTEDRYLELISAEWQYTRVALRRSSHPDCINAVKADLEILTEIRHPHTLLLMGTTRTDEHGIVAIFESVDCTLYNYIHEQGERISVQGAARCAGQLADALRHAHARKIIHGALTSHCVFIAATGTAKLGGWELAVREDEPRPYREWEGRLRTEIFRWQAPEMFYGDTPNRTCDVYALTLLIWEMCTGQVPWSGLNEAEIERQYIHWERGIAMDTYSFPPLLSNLLEAGLQLDVNKRKLDMNRARRFLRKLELKYEEEALIYVDRHSNNNNPHVKTFNAPVATSPLIKSPALTPKRESIEINNTLMGKKLFNCEKTSKDEAMRKSPDNEVHSKKCKAYGHDAESRDSADRLKKNTNIYLDSQKKNYGHLFCPSPRKEVSELSVKMDQREKPIHPDGRRHRRSTNETITIEDKMDEKKYLPTDESSFSETTTATETASSSSDESANDTMTDLKKLKELLAEKRSNFFYGHSSPTHMNVPEVSDSAGIPDVPDIPHSSPLSKEMILKEARSRSCEPCKPASHKINLEPQLCKSPTEYDPTLVKSTNRQNHRVPKSPLSIELKQAILHPEMLQSSNSDSFFETSLWKKEKLICLSKMRKDYPLIDGKSAPKLQRCPKNDSTYVIDNDTPGSESNMTYENHTKINDTTTDLDVPENYSFQSVPLKALGKALDRATDIICSGKSSNETSPIKSLHDSHIIPDESGEDEAMFESLNRSKLGSGNTEEDIQTIERSSNQESEFLHSTKELTKEISPESQICASVTFPDTKEKSKCVSFGLSSAELRREYEDDQNESCKTREDNILSKASMVDDSLVQRLHDFTCNDLLSSYAVDPNDSLNHLAEKSLVSTALIFLSNKSQDKGCRSCQHKNLLARRRSLPAGLGQFRSTGNASPLGRLPIRRAGVPDSMVEDLYIDDEFGDNLNINMVLLEDENEPDDQDLLSSLL
ncbi:uncharacterized protein LOC105688880 isoform X2 [Athalia rosae]|uniref:uncharacterized protein LOC105688880 isoform X2 n=1 Tax=Athalia rosae TaxID=37344 RepID=UPI002033E5DC|nr:uncharacterized protein LOC105688880 isoform X2 [Athalia rosae]